MRKKTGTAVLVCLVALLAAGVAGCSRPGNAPLAKEDKINVKIQLDLKEDIGLLLTSWEADGHDGMSGASNADKSMIKRDSTEYWTLEKQYLDDPADTVDLSLRFIIVTEYFEPNYDFVFPEECMMPTDAVSFAADFGETYLVAITGDKENGYQAALDGPD